MDPETQLGLLEQLDLELEYSLDPKRLLSLPPCLSISISLVDL